LIVAARAVIHPDAPALADLRPKSRTRTSRVLGYPHIAELGETGGLGSGAID